MTDINSQTRADCHGMRPDLYAALSGSMVKKDDITGIEGVKGYINLTCRTVPQDATASYFIDADIVSELVKNAEFKVGNLEDLTGWAHIDGNNGKCGVITLNTPGLWIITYSATGSFAPDKYDYIIAELVSTRNTEIGIVNDIIFKAYEKSVIDDVNKTLTIISAIPVADTKTITVRLSYTGNRAPGNFLSSLTCFCLS